MQSHRVAHHAGGNHHAVELLHDKENDRDPQRMDPIVELDKRDEDRWNVADSEADDRHQAQESQEKANQETELKPKNGEPDRRQRPIDHADHQLPPEEIDQVAVYLRQNDYDLVLEFGLPNRQIIAPGLGDPMALHQKEEEIDRNDQQADEKPKHPKDAGDAT